MKETFLVIYSLPIKMHS